MATDERELMRRLARFLGLGVKEEAYWTELFQLGPGRRDGTVPYPGCLWTVDGERPFTGRPASRGTPYPRPGFPDRLEEPRGLFGFEMRPESGWPRWLRKGMSLEELELRLAARGF